MNDPVTRALTSDISKMVRAYYYQFVPQNISFPKIQRQIRTEKSDTLA
jgi:hypothetical protein